MRPLNNLPCQLTSFIGREREIAEVSHLLASARLVTLTGAGGCGKTRLAVQVTTDLCCEAGMPSPFPDGVWLIEFAPLFDPTLIAQRLAAALDVQEQAGQSLLQTLIDHLRVQQLLLLLDNCEHLIEPCARIVTILLQSCPQLHILATSREALNVPGEVHYWCRRCRCQTPTSQVQCLMRMLTYRHRMLRPILSSARAKHRVPASLNPKPCNCSSRVPAGSRIGQPCLRVV